MCRSACMGKSVFKASRLNTKQQKKPICNIGAMKQDSRYKVRFLYCNDFNTVYVRGSQG